MYGQPCKASDYGFSRISEVIDAVSNVAEIRGKGAEKMVVLVDGDNVSLLGPGSKMKLLFFLLFFTVLWHWH